MNARMSAAVSDLIDASVPLPVNGIAYAWPSPYSSGGSVRSARPVGCVFSCAMPASHWPRMRAMSSSRKAGLRTMSANSVSDGFELRRQRVELTRARVETRSPRRASRRGVRSRRAISSESRSSVPSSSIAMVNAGGAELASLVRRVAAIEQQLHLHDRNRVAFGEHHLDAVLEFAVLSFGKFRSGNASTSARPCCGRRRLRRVVFARFGGSTRLGAPGAAARPSASAFVLSASSACRVSRSACSRPCAIHFFARRSTLAGVAARAREVVLVRAGIVAIDLALGEDRACCRPSPRRA